MRNTSIDSYIQIKNNSLLSEKRFQVYDLLYRHGPATAGELFQIIQKNTINSRLSELQALGVVSQVGDKVCNFTGKLSTLWDVTSDLPKGSADLLKLQENHNVKLSRAQLQQKILLYRKLVLGIREYLQHDAKAVARINQRISEIDGL